MINKVKGLGEGDGMADEQVRWKGSSRRKACLEMRRYGKIQPEYSHTPLSENTHITLNIETNKIKEIEIKTIPNIVYLIILF